MRRRVAAWARIIVSLVDEFLIGSEAPRPARPKLRQYGAMRTGKSRLRDVDRRRVSCQDTIRTKGLN